MLQKLLLVSLAITAVLADEGIPEPSDSKVHVINFDTFNRFVKAHPIVMMEFYAPWCGHCQNLAPTYRAAAKQMSEMDLPHPVVFAKYNDGDEYNRQLRGGAEDVFNYSGYPALMIFKDKKIKVANKEHWKRKYKGRRWQFYGGGRDKPEDFTFYLTAVAKSLDPFDEERKARPGFYKKGGKHATTFIDELEPDGDLGFNTTVLEDPNNRLWVVEFYSDHCPFCNSLAPEITKAAQQVRKVKPGLIEFGAINSRVYDEVATEHEVTSWPWIAAFYQGKKVEDMTGLGGSDSVVRFSNEMFDKYWKKKPPKNKFLESEWASANKKDEGQCSTEGPTEECGGGGEGGEKTKKKSKIDELEALLEEASQFKMEDKDSVLQVWVDIKASKKKERGKAMQAAINTATRRLAPIRELAARVKELEAEVAALKAAK